MYEASRSRNMADTRTYQLNLESVDLSFDFVLLRIVERLVGLASAVHDISELLNLGDGDSGAGGAGGRGGLGLLGRAVRGSWLRLRGHSEEREQKGAGGCVEVVDAREEMCLA